MAPLAQSDAMSATETVSTCQITSRITGPMKDNEKRDSVNGSGSSVCSADGGQPNRFIWFFRIEGGGNQCAEYYPDTEDRDEAIDWLRLEYGNRATHAIRRELTFAEYAGLLRCNFEGHGEKVYAAMQDFFFRCDPREI